MNNSLDKLNKVFEISDLCYLQEKKKSISKLNEELEREFQSGSVTYSTLQIYFRIVLKTIKHLINYRVTFDIKEVNSLIETNINETLLSNIFEKISKRGLETIEEEFQYLIDEITNFSKGLFPNYMLDWINEEIVKEKNTILEKVKTDIVIQKKRHELKSDGKELSEEQEKDREKYGYKCRDKVHIPGTSSLYRSNEIIVNKANIKIGDSLFLLLLRLVVELKKREGGWINMSTLHIDRIITDPDKYQIYSRLRTTLQGSLIDKDGKKFIENDGSKNYRISTHPDFITYNKEKLLSHQDSQIRKLAEELPNN